MQIKIDIAVVFPLLGVDCQYILWESNVVAAKCSISCTKPALHTVYDLFSLVELLSPNCSSELRVLLICTMCLYLSPLFFFFTGLQLFIFPPENV